MDRIIESMFKDVVVYVWLNPVVDEDMGALLIEAENLRIVQDLTENICDVGYEQAVSFDNLKRLLQVEDIGYFDITDSIYCYIHDE
jgi:hypothetical protein